MEEIQDTPKKTSLLGRITWVVLFIAALYSLYVVVHPFTPLSDLRISILDMVQLERAVHVFLLMFAG